MNKINRVAATILTIYALTAAGPVAAESWTYIGRGTGWAMAVDAANVRKSGATVTLTELSVAETPSHMPPPKHDFLTAEVVVNCEDRTALKKNYAFYAFGRARATNRSPGMTESYPIKDLRDRRLYRAACTDFLVDETRRGLPTETAEDWAKGLVDRMKAPDPFQDPVKLQDWVVSRPTGDTCFLSSSFGNETFATVYLTTEGQEKLELRAPEYRDLALGPVAALVATRVTGGEWIPLPETSTRMLKGRVMVESPVLLRALNGAHELGIAVEGTPPQRLEVGPMDVAVYSVRDCILEHYNY